MVRCLVLDPAQRGIVLQALYPMPQSLSELSTNVQEAYETYRTRAYMRGQIKFSFALSLSLVLLLGLFAARRTTLLVACLAGAARTSPSSSIRGSALLPRCRLRASACPE